jgi:hypothetical protein
LSRQWAYIAGVLSLLAAIPAQASDHFDRIGESEGWQTYGLPTEGPGAYVEGDSVAGAPVATLRLGYDAGRPGALYLALSPSAPEPRDGEKVSIRIKFDNGDVFDLAATATSGTIQALMDAAQVAPWTHDFTALKQMTVELGAASWAFSLAGTTPSIGSFAKYLSDRGVTGLPKPFDALENAPSRPIAAPSAAPFSEVPHQGSVAPSPSVRVGKVDGTQPMESGDEIEPVRDTSLCPAATTPGQIDALRIAAPAEAAHIADLGHCTIVLSPDTIKTLGGRYQAIVVWGAGRAPRSRWK